MGSHYLRCTFDNFVPRPGTELALKEARAFVEEFAIKPGKWLLFCGNPGSGKTHLGMAIRNAIEERYGVLALATTQPYLLTQIQATWSRRPGDWDPEDRSEEWMLERLQRAPFLLWDDLMPFKDWAYERLFTIIDARYRNNRAMVLTTNLTAEEVEKALGPRLWSRLIGRAVVVPVTAEDYRVAVERKRL